MSAGRTPDTIAVETAVNGAYFQTGQRCTACSRLIVEESVADALVARDIGFVFVTGCGDHGMLAYRDRPILNKPFQIDALTRCCKRALE